MASCDPEHTLGANVLTQLADVAGRAEAGAGGGVTSAAVVTQTHL